MGGRSSKNDAPLELDESPKSRAFTRRPGRQKTGKPWFGAWIDLLILLLPLMEECMNDSVQALHFLELGVGWSNATTRAGSRLANVVS